MRFTKDAEPSRDATGTTGFRRNVNYGPGPFLGRMARDGGRPAPRSFEALCTGGVTLSSMIWLYERDNQSIRLDTKYDNDTNEYVVVVHRPDGPQQVERFSDAEACRQWLVTFENSLDAEHWTRRGPPVFLPDGWPRGL